MPPLNDGSNFAGPLRYDRLAIASLVCAIGSCLKFFWGRQFGVPLFPLAFVLGILALKRIKAEPGRLKGRGMALAGMILVTGFPLLILLSYIAIGLTGGMPF